MRICEPCVLHSYCVYTQTLVIVCYPEYTLCAYNILRRRVLVMGVYRAN
jgi:hypothetical protein